MDQEEEEDLEIKYWCDILWRERRRECLLFLFCFEIYDKKKPLKAHGITDRMLCEMSWAYFHNLEWKDSWLMTREAFEHYFSDDFELFKILSYEPIENFHIMFTCLNGI